MCSDQSFAVNWEFRRRLKYKELIRIYYDIPKTIKLDKAVPRARISRVVEDQRKVMTFPKGRSQVVECWKSGVRLVWPHPSLF